MKKFLAVFDGYKMSESTVGYAIQLTKSADAHLVGIFLNEFIYHSYSVYEVMTTYKDYEEVLEKLNAIDAKKREAAALEFQRICEKAGVQFSIHKDNIIAIQELKHESMFADLIIINESETFTRYKEPLPTRFIKDLLGDVQCPVLIVPSVFKPVNKIICLYDGAPAALHAIKMFSYILNNPQNLPVEVFTVKEKKQQGLHVPDNKLMREFIKRHFPKATFTVLKGDAELEISNYLRNHPENELVVLGAYHRSELSRWFKMSMADILMKELNMPLFIAHNK
jgi:nucleotide-binding universal stress UspA family protein